jgi:hypothetical protein
VNRRDRAVVVALLLVLVALGAIVAMPRQAATLSPEEPTAEITMPPRVVYREGVVGVPDSITPQPRGAHARRSRVLGSRAAGTGHDLPARSRLLLVE